MRCDGCYRESPVLWRVAEWRGGGHAKDLCPVCALRVLGQDDTLAFHDQCQFLITEEIRLGSAGNARKVSLGTTKKAWVSSRKTRVKVP